MSNDRKYKSKNVMMQIAGILLCLVLFFAWVLSGLFAKYKTENGVSDGARVASFGDITIEEEGNFFDEANNKFLLTPGVNIFKQASVSFDGSETATYVFIRVKASQWTKNGNYGFKTGGASGNAITFSVNNYWTFLKNESGNAIYYKVLEPNATLENQTIITDGTVYVSDTLKRTELDTIKTNGLTLGFDAFVCQGDGFGETSTAGEHAEEAWDSVKTHS